MELVLDKTAGLGSTADLFLRIRENLTEHYFLQNLTQWLLL